MKKSELVTIAQYTLATKEMAAKLCRDGINPADVMDKELQALGPERGQQLCDEVNKHVNTKYAIRRPVTDGEPDRRDLWGFLNGWK